MYEHLREFAQAASQTSAFFAGTFIFTSFTLWEWKKLSWKKVDDTPRIQIGVGLLIVGIGLLLFVTVSATVSVTKFPEDQALVMEDYWMLSNIYYYGMLPGLGFSLLGLLAVGSYHPPGQESGG